MTVTTKKLKTLAKVYNGATPKSDNIDYWDGNIAWATPIDLGDSKYLQSTKRNITPAGYNSCNTTLLKPGNVVISCRAPIGLVAVNQVPVCTNQGCKALELDRSKIDESYLYYVLKSSEEKLNVLGTGTTFMEISSDALKNFNIPYVSLNEQKRIANYLDKKTQTLDKMIAAKKHTRALLSELRQSIINREIFTDSGDTMNVQLRRIVALQTAKQGADVDIPIITLENVESWTGKLLDYTEHESVSGELVAYKKDDVLFNKLRPYLAKVHTAKSNGLCSGEMLVLRPDKKKIDSRYLFYFLISNKTISDVDVATYGVKMPRANWETVGSLELDLPSLEEQREIVARLDTQLTKVEEADATLLQSISQLEEYRSSLISNVVGGKVEV